MISKLSKSRIDKMKDLDLLEWFNEQEFPWREEISEMSNARSLKGMIDFIRTNYESIKQIENEKARINREAPRRR